MAVIPATESCGVKHFIGMKVDVSLRETCIQLVNRVSSHLICLSKRGFFSDVTMWKLKDVRRVPLLGPRSSTDVLERRHSAQSRRPNIGRRRSFGQVREGCTDEEKVLCALSDGRTSRLQHAVRLAGTSGWTRTAPLLMHWRGSQKLKILGLCVIPLSRCGPSCSGAAPRSGNSPSENVGSF